MDKVVVHRVGQDVVRTRIIWKGGETTTKDLSVPVKSLAALSKAKELETLIVELAQKDIPDQDIAEQLTQSGFRSPARLTLLPSTVKRIRLQHGIMIKEHQSHPRKVPGYLTVTQIVSALQVEYHWVYDRIHKGTILVSRDPQTNLYLFPDQPSTIERFKKLKSGKVKRLHF